MFIFRIDIYYILVMFVTVCWCWGVNYTFSDGEIFGKIGNWGRKHLPQDLISPIYDCPFCMSSLHGTLFYLMFLQEYGVIMWVIFCFGICGFSAFVKK